MRSKFLRHKTWALPCTALLELNGLGHEDGLIEFEKVRQGFFSLVKTSGYTDKYKNRGKEGLLQGRVISPPFIW